MTSIQSLQRKTSALELLRDLTRLWVLCLALMLVACSNGNVSCGKVSAEEFMKTLLDYKRFKSDAFIGVTEGQAFKKLALPICTLALGRFFGFPKANCQKTI